MQHSLSGGKFADLFGLISNTVKQQISFRSFGEFAIVAAISISRVHTAPKRIR